MKPEDLRDYVNDKTESLFDSVTARWITWATMTVAALYFGIILFLHLLV